MRVAHQGAWLRYLAVGDGEHIASKRMGDLMGSEQLCTVRAGGKTSTGKALLETSEIVFRGDFRLKIPIASLQSAVVKDGELRLKWKDGSAIFELGERAAKWAETILHP